MRLKLPSKMSRNFPAEYFILTNLQSEGAILGQLAGAPIAETMIDEHGRRYHFAGVARHSVDGGFDVDSLQTGEWIVQPGLVYRMDMPRVKTA